MQFNEKRILGRTGLLVGRLGISSSFGAPAAAFEEAFDKGCNYFTWGTFIKGRSPEMKKAIKSILAKNQRDKLVISLYTYAHNAYLTERFLIKGLRELGIEYADVLILGYHPKRPQQKIIDGALDLKQKGLVHFLGITSHNRKIYPELLKENIFDIFHIRYNAVHRGAEIDIFPYLDDNNRPGIVSFTATRWRKLLKQKKMPAGVTALTAMDCYRFVLSNPKVDICMMGARTKEQMTENLKTLESGPLSQDELIRVKKIGDYLYK
jgi:aryl-alcohol dehydrogenase-like predicted oxidoreductase